MGREFAVDCFWVRQCDLGMRRLFFGRRIGVLVVLAGMCGLDLAIGQGVTDARSAAEPLLGMEVTNLEKLIRDVRSDVVSKYEAGLSELQVGYQKAADLEGALAVRRERARLQEERALAESNLVEEPKQLRAFQDQYLQNQQRLVVQAVNNALPRMVELKRALTVGGKLDDAVRVRDEIRRIQQAYLPEMRSGEGEVVTAEEVAGAYAANAERADTAYRGRKLLVRGRVVSFRDGKEGGKASLVLAGGEGRFVEVGMVEGTRVRAETAGVAGGIAVTVPDGAVLRLGKGQVVEVRGRCEGLDGVVRLSDGQLKR
ncbi:MAG: tRNA anti-like [Verrucomicrobiota bacterium]